MGSDANLNGASPFVHHLVNAHLEHLSIPEGSAAQYHAMIEVISGMGPQSGASLVGDGRLLATVRVEEQAFRLCRGCRGGTTKGTLGGQRPQDGIVPAETVTVVIIMDYGHFHSHSIQVYHTIDYWWCQRSSYTLIDAINEEVQGRVGLPREANMVTLLQLIQTELTVLAARTLAVGQDPTATHHDGA